MRAKRFIIAALAVIGLTATAGSAFAWFGHHAGDAHAKMAKIKKFIDWRLNDVLDDLEADAAQRAEINRVKDRLVELGEGYAKSRPETRKAFLAQWNAETPDAKAVHQLVDDRLDEIRALAHQAADGALEVHKTLNPKQRAEITKMITERWGE